MQDIIIVGASGFGRELLFIIEDINKNKPEWNVLGFIDDNSSALDGIECEKRIIGNIDSWKLKGSEL